MAIKNKLVPVAKFKNGKDSVVLLADVAYDTVTGIISSGEARMMYESALVTILNSGKTIPFLKVSTSATGKQYISRVSGSMEPCFKVYSFLSRGNVALFLCPVHKVNGENYCLIVRIGYYGNYRYGKNEIAISCTSDILTDEQVKNFPNLSQCDYNDMQAKGCHVMTVTGFVAKSTEGAVLAVQTPELELEDARAKETRKYTCVTEKMERLTELYNMNSEINVHAIDAADCIGLYVRDNELNEKIAKLRNMHYEAVMCNIVPADSTALDSNVRAAFSTQINGVINGKSIVRRVMQYTAVQEILKAIGLGNLMFNDTVDEETTLRIIRALRLVEKCDYKVENITPEDYGEGAKCGIRTDQLEKIMERSVGVTNDSIIAHCMAAIASVLGDYRTNKYNVDLANSSLLRFCKISSYNYAKMSATANIGKQRLYCAHGLGKVAILSMTIDTYGCVDKAIIDKFGEPMIRVHALFDESTYNMIWTGEPIDIYRIDAGIMDEIARGEARLITSIRGEKYDKRCNVTEIFKDGSRKCIDISKGLTLGSAPFACFSLPILNTTLTDGYRPNKKVHRSYSPIFIDGGVDIVTADETWSDRASDLCNLDIKVSVRLTFNEVIERLRAFASTKSFIKPHICNDAELVSKAETAINGNIIATMLKELRSDARLVRASHIKEEVVKDDITYEKGMTRKQVNTTAIEYYVPCANMLSLYSIMVKKTLLGRVDIRRMSGRILATVDNLYLSDKLIDLGTGIGLHDMVVPNDCTDELKQLLNSILHKENGKITVKHNGSSIEIKTLGGAMVINNLYITG